jgi:hypothetical protein
MKIKNMMRAISTETIAMPENPSTPAIKAIIKNVITQLSINVLL